MPDESSDFEGWTQIHYDRYDLDTSHLLETTTFESVIREGTLYRTRTRQWDGERPVTVTEALVFVPA